MSAAELPPPVNPDDPGLGPFALGLTWTLNVIAIFAVAARFYARRKFTRKWSSDDWIMLLALVVQIAYQAGFTLMFTQGAAGKKFENSTAEERYLNTKWTWIFAPPGFFVSIAARISIAIMLVRIFGTKRWFKWFLIIFTAIQTVLGIVSIIMILAQTQPFRAYWDKDIPHTRWNRSIYEWTAVTLQFFFVASDILFVLLPVLIIWDLNMRTSRKIGLMLVMGLSLITAGSAVAKITVSLIPMTGSPLLGNPSSQYFGGIINLASNCEQCLVIIMGCIPTLQQMTKLKFKMFSLHSLGTSFSSLLSGKRSERTTQKSSSAYQLSGQYHDLELRPKVDPSEDSESTKMVSGAPVVVGAAEPYAYESGKDWRQIQRRDSFSISYKQQVRAEERV